MFACAKMVYQMLYVLPFKIRQARLVSSYHDATINLHLFTKIFAKIYTF